MKKILFNVFTIFILTSLFIWLIIVSKEIPKTAGFSRHFTFVDLKFIKAIDLHSSTFRIIGKLENDIALKDYKNPKNIVLLDSVHHLLKSLRVNVEFKKKSNYINHDHFNKHTILSNSKGEIYKINNRDWSFKFFQSTLLFDQAVSISNSSLVSRSKQYQANQMQRSLKKVVLNKYATESANYNFDEPSSEIFSSDGWLHFDKQHSKLVYMFYYTGKFICLDTNLKVLYNAKTIDTIVVPRIKTRKLVTQQKDGSVIRSTIQTNLGGVVNQYMTTYNGHIFILSKIKSNNENSTKAKNGRAIDTYSLLDGHYLYSFYIPDYRGLKLRSFYVEKNALTAIYDDFLVIYDYKNVSKYHP
jgi:hypothetical protein